MRRGNNDSCFNYNILIIYFAFRVLGGVTLSPRPFTYCKQNISDFSVCDSEQKEIAIDENYCLSVDHLGRPVDIYSNIYYYYLLQHI